MRYLMLADSRMMRMTNKRKKEKRQNIVLWSVFLLITLALLSLAHAENISILAGSAYYAEIDTMSPTSHWAGLKVTNNAVELSDSDLPFVSLNLNSPVISAVSFPGANLKDDLHYYGAMLADSFRVTNVINITSNDLLGDQLFNSDNYSTFYPDYVLRQDNPQFTFCCEEAQVDIGGFNFTAFRITIEDDVDYYLLKYNDSGVMYPLFVVPLQDQTCFNHTSCVGEFMLPVSDSPYNFYALSKYPVYGFRVWIDGVETSIIDQTALAYNVTIFLNNTYTGETAPNMSILIGEEEGQNIFIPYKLSGYISYAYSIGRTDDNGIESFLAAPTVYPTVNNYSIYLAVLLGDLVTNKHYLSITSMDEIVYQSKALSPAALYDNAKVTVNAMNQINNYLFKWASENEAAKTFTVIYSLNSASWSITDHAGGSGTLYLKTGAPNAITVSVRNFGVPVSGYYSRIKEEGGYLIVHPYTATSPITGKLRTHYQKIPTSMQFIVTPTSIGYISSNVTLEILDSDNNVVATRIATIDNSLGLTPSVSYNNDLLKTIVNAMNQALNSLFYSLNN